MKYLLAKLMAIIMLGTMLLGAASAQAVEKGWRWVSYPSILAYDEFTTANLHALCVIVVKANADSSGSAREYIGSYEVISDIVYCEHKILPSGYLSTAQMRPHCRFGGVWNPTRPEGCYELKEGAPENCHVVGESQGYPVCGDEPDYPINDDYLCGLIEVEIPETARGYVGCEERDDKTKKSLCLLKDKIKAKYPSEEAHDIIINCFATHERSHANQPTSESTCYKGSIASNTSKFRYAHEVSAYNTQKACLDKALEDNLCANTDVVKAAQCRSSLEKASRGARAMRNSFQRELDAP